MSDGQGVVLIAAPEDEGDRLDRFLARTLPDYSRTYLARLIGSSFVTVNGQPSGRARQLVRQGDRIEVFLPAPEPSTVLPEAIPLDVLYEDDWLAVVVKPAGLTVHPGAGQKSGTLANALAYRFQSLSAGHPDRPGIVHRLDRNTSGLLVVAKSERSHHKVARQFQRREVRKSYLALVFGTGLDAHGKIDAPIGRHPVHRTRMGVTRSGREALTLYDALERFEEFTYLKLDLRTGRTHQIRVHLAHLNHPIVGDSVYGRGRIEAVRRTEVRDRLRGLGRLFLHATELSFRHPRSGDLLQFESPLPAELADILHFLREPRGVVK